MLIPPSYMPSPIDQVPGLYTHYKQGRYSVLFTATHSETLDPLVIYVSMQTGEAWARPEASWRESVVWPDGATRPRFVRLKEEEWVRRNPQQYGPK
jgi:hypothetical protein